VATNVNWIRSPTLASVLYEPLEFIWLVLATLLWWTFFEPFGFPQLKSNCDCIVSRRQMHIQLATMQT